MVVWYRARARWRVSRVNAQTIGASSLKNPAVRALSRQMQQEIRNIEGLAAILASLFALMLQPLGRPSVVETFRTRRLQAFPYPSLRTARHARVRKRQSPERLYLPRPQNS